MGELRNLLPAQSAGKTCFQPDQPRQDTIHQPAPIRRQSDQEPAPVVGIRIADYETVCLKPVQAAGEPSAAE
jgi:hypothetical protein